jgi:hypothetical protein
MLMNIPYIADFIALRNARQLKINQRLLHANRKRPPHDFQVNQQVMLRNSNMQSKLSTSWLGLYPVIRVHTNGTITVALPNGVHDRRNIRQFKPA